MLPFPLSFLHSFIPSFLHSFIPTLGIVLTSIILCQERHYDLRVTSGSKGSTLQQGLSVFHTPFIHVPTSLHVIQCIAHHRQILHKLIREDILGIGAHLHLVLFAFDSRIHHLNRLHSGGGLALADIAIAEEELTAEIAAFNSVHIRNVETASGTGRHAHESEILDHLTANSACSNEEDLTVGETFLERSAEENVLTVVTGANFLTVICI